MPRPLSMDLRRRIADAVKAGLSRHAAAKRFVVAPSSVIKLMQAYGKTGSLAPKQMGGYRKPILAAHAETVKALVAERPDATLAELGAALRRRKIRVSRSALAAYLGKLRLTFKKTLHASEQDRPDVAQARAAHVAAQPELPSAKLVFIDETAVTTTMVRRHGRAQAGQRLIAKVPHGHWKITPCIAALTAAGITALGSIDGALNGELFHAWVVQVLVPTLKPGDIVIWDNLPCHKNKAARAAIQATGATVRPLPAYSPDLNPIENAFAKFKAKLRKAKPRSKDALDRCIAKIFQALTRKECLAYFKHCGYSN